MGNGPAAVAMNLRITRAFGIGPKTEPGSSPASGGGPGGGSPMGVSGRGGFGGGFGGGRGIMGGLNTGHKYSLSLSAQALNLFNNIDYGQPVGVVTDSRFGRSTSLAQGIFSSGSAARRVFFQATFSF